MEPTRSATAGRLLTAVATTVAYVAAVLALASPAPAGASEQAAAAADLDGPLTVDGRLFRDPQGRVVVMHGLMGVWKQPPYFPAGEDDAEHPQTPSFTDGDADIMESMGLDSMRLAWFWQGLEPTEGTFDTTYRDGMLAVEDKLAERGIYTILDSHQDQFNTLFGDKPGFPSWAADYDGLPIAPAPSDPGYAAWKFPLGYAQPSTQRAFGHLYENTDEVWSAYGAAWQYMAQAFDHSPMVVGYDLMNEPWATQHPGASPQYDFASCSQASGCRDWDRHVLQPLMESLAGSIRQVDPDRTVFFEPTINFNSGKPNHFEPPPADLEPVGLSFHNQCSTRVQYSITKDESLIEKGHQVCPPEEANAMHNADDAAAALGGPPLMTEVAPTADKDSQGLNCLLERADYFQTGFTYGLSWSNPNDELRRLHAESAPGGRQPYKEQVLARVYPRAIAGTPEAYAFDVRTGRFELSYETDGKVTAPTVVSVPTAIQYPSGYDVAVEGGSVTSADDADLLTIANDAGAGRVRVVVTPVASDGADRPDFPPCVMDPTDRLATTASVDGGTRRDALDHGLPVTASCTRACDLDASLRIRRDLARRLGLKPDQPGDGFVVVATLATTGLAGEETSFRVPFKARAKRALLERKRLRGQLRVVATLGHAANPGEPVRRIRPVRFSPAR